MEELNSILTLGQTILSKIINGNDDGTANNNIGDDNEQKIQISGEKFQFLYHTQE